jgi:hypothetical protein
MQALKPDDYPVYLHTQPSSFRAIKLYSDFGFSLLCDDKVGVRKNDLQACLPILKKFMPKSYFDELTFRHAPKDFLHSLNKYNTHQF